MLAHLTIAYKSNGWHASVNVAVSGSHFELLAIGEKEESHLAPISEIMHAQLPQSCGQVCSPAATMLPFRGLQALLIMAMLCGE